MKKKLLLTLGFVLVFAITLAFAASALDTVVYVKDGGTGNGSSPDEATSTLTSAYSKLDLNDDCTVVICGPYTQNVTWVWKGGDYDGSVTFTSVYDGVDYRETDGATYSFKAVRFVCFGETKFENLDFVCTGTNMLVVGQCNPITVGEGVTMTGKEMTGGSIAKSFCILGGYQKDQSNPPSSSTEDINITVLSGSAIYIVPFTRNIAGEYTGTATVKIGGNAEVGVLHGSSAYPDGIKVGDLKVEISGNAHIRNFYGCTNDATLNSIEMTWKSGTIDEFYWVCPNTPGKKLDINNTTVLNATPTAKDTSNFAAIAGNFDKVNDIADEVVVRPDALTNATVVYIKDGGTGNGSSAEKALPNINEAMAALDLSKDCTIVVCGEYALPNPFNYGKDFDGSVTFTSVYGGVDYRKSGAKVTFKTGRFVCWGETTFENMDFVCTGTNLLVVGQHNPVTVGEGVTISGGSLSGGAVNRSFAILGSYQHRVGEYPYVDDRDTHITVLSGSYIYVIPFSRDMLGDYMGTAYVTIGGNAELGVLHGSAVCSTPYPDGVSVGNVKLTVKDNAKIKAFYGCTQVTNVNSIEFNWLGGTISKFEWNCAATPSADYRVANKTVLKVADSVKAGADNFDAIAKNFDIVTTPSDTANYVIPAAPAIETNYGAARGLFTLGLAQGYDTTGTNFGLDDSITRIQTVVQVIRFLGKEAEVKAGTFTHPFTDVPAWANNYVGYAYANNITSGRSATKFDPDGVVDEMQFLTFMLRAIGYEDAKGDFVWNNPYTLATKVRMSKADGTGSIFNRGDAFRTSWDALYATAKNGNRVYDNLIANGTITSAKLDAAVKEAQTAKAEINRTPIADVEESGYNVISIEEYKDKTFAGYMAQFTGFLSGYEFARASDGTPRLAMPDSWFMLVNGPYAEYNKNNVHEDKLRFNEESGVWEVWNDDDYSIDILDQYILRDMYNQYGTFASKLIKDGWINYNVYDMGGGHRSYGAYGLFSRYNYLANYVGATEFGNEYNVNGEPYIGNETLGFTAAGMPDVAIELADIFGSVTSDREPTLWLKYFTALISMAYFEDDIPAMMRQAQGILPKDSHPYRVIDIAFELYEKYPNDWRRAVVHAERLCHQSHFDLSETAVGETGTNCSFILLGLLYGEGDFYETCKIIGLAGHGGDSTNPVGLSVAAVACGWKGVDEESKKIINEKIWQDGKGILLNVAGHENSAYWMFYVGLPERISLSSIFDMYVENFEKTLLENGGKIENGNYYIPKSNLSLTETVFYNDFEGNNLNGFKSKGTVEIVDAAYAGDYSARLVGSATESTELYTTINGLTVGADYRITVFANASAGTALTVFARESGKAAVATATVYDQTKFVKRELTFTATAATMEVGFSLPKGVGEYKTATVDEFEVIKVEEIKTGTATVKNASANNEYTGAVTVHVQANDTKETYLKVTFANTANNIVAASVNLDGVIYGTVPFSKTGTTSADVCTTYIPVISSKGNTAYDLTFNLGTSKLYIHSVELVDIVERW